MEEEQQTTSIRAATPQDLPFRKQSFSSILDSETTLAQMGLEVATLFERNKYTFHAGRIASDFEPDKIENERQRFDLWAANLGLHQRGHASLDYRFRDAPRLYEYVFRLLSDLRFSLQVLIEQIKTPANASVGEEPNATPSESSSDLEMPEYPDDSSDEELLGGYENESVFQTAFIDVVDSIDRLFQVSMKIRNPKTRTGFAKAREYTQIDHDTGIDLIEQFAAYDQRHIMALFGASREDFNQHYLLQRLAHANTKRRQQFAYWSSHRLNLSRASMLLPRQLTPEASNAVYVPSGSHDHSGPSAKRFKPTTATSSRTSKDDINEVESVATTTSALILTEGDTRDEIWLPHPPKRFLDTPDLKEFECPYCFTVCHRKELKPTSWKLKGVGAKVAILRPVKKTATDGIRCHIIRDLRPYVCTYETCRDSDQLFDSISDWVSHDLSHQFGTDTDAPGQTSNYSWGSFSQLQDASRQCPLCLNILDSYDLFFSHVAVHLVRVAAFSLPRSTVADQDLDEQDNASRKGGRPTDTEGSHAESQSHYWSSLSSDHVLSVDARGLSIDETTSKIDSTTEGLEALARLGFEYEEQNDSPTAIQIFKRIVRRHKRWFGQGSPTPAFLAVVVQHLSALHRSSGESDSPVQSVPSREVALATPSFLLRLDEMRSSSSQSPYTISPATHEWRPPTRLGLNRLVSGGVSGRYYSFNGRGLRHIFGLPEATLPFKEFSMYYNDGRIWVLPYDATRYEVGRGPPGVSYISWCPLSFFHLTPSGTTASYATYSGNQTRLAYQRPDQIWVRHLIPPSYHAYGPQITQYPGYGGMNGHLPIILGLIMLSADPADVEPVMEHCLPGNQWRSVPGNSGWSDQRGVVVRVYAPPGEGFDKLEAFEQGRLGIIYP